jgi:GAF domain-containing protein
MASSDDRRDPLVERAAESLRRTEKSGGEQFSEEDEQALVRLAELAGVAIHNARRYRGVEAQRAELARAVDAPARR